MTDLIEQLEKSHHWSIVRDSGQIHVVVDGRNCHLYPTVAEAIKCLPSLLELRNFDLLVPKGLQSESSRGGQP